MSVIGNGILNLLTPPTSGSKWYFNSSMSYPGVSFTYDVYFTSNGYSYVKLQLTGFKKSWYLYYHRPSLQRDVAYSYRTVGWNSEYYRTITITGGEDATNPDFLAWLEANAIQIN